MKRTSADLEGLADRVQARGSALGRPIHVLPSTTSTNDEARMGAKRGAPHGATWVAERQTAGRGRHGRAWIDVPGESLLFSVLLRVDCAPSRLPPIALVAGLAVRDAIGRALPPAAAPEVMLKWPNDVQIAGRKVAGVLVEAITVGRRVDAVVVGVGVNVHTREFPEAIADRATSVALAATRAPGGALPPDRAGLLADVLAGFDHDLHVVLSRGLGLVRARLEAADGLRGHRVRNESGAEGEALGMDDDGRLRVRGGDGRITSWVAGEVHLVRA